MGAAKLLIRENSSRTSKDCVNVDRNLKSKLEDDCLWKITGLQILDYRIVGRDQQTKHCSSTLWLRKLARNEAALNASLALGHQAVIRDRQDQTVQKAQEHYLTALSLVNRSIACQADLVSLTQTVAILCVYCFFAMDLDGCQTHYQALQVMVKQMGVWDLLDQVDRNLLLLSSSLAAKILLAASVIDPTDYGCGSWNNDGMTASYRGVFLLGNPPLASCLQDIEGTKTFSAIQECRHLASIRMQLRLHPHTRSTIFLPVHNWIEARYHVLNITLVDLIHDTSQRQHPVWKVIIIGMLCSLHIIHGGTQNLAQSWSIPFSHLRHSIETLNHTSRPLKYSDALMWSTFIGACGEKIDSLGFGSTDRWLTKQFQSLIASQNIRRSGRVKAILTQFLYDDELMGSFLAELMG